MISKLFVVGALLVSAEVAMAGASNAQVDCKSASGRTVISANVPGDFVESMTQITVDGKTQTYLDEGMVDSMKLNGQDPEQVYPGFRLASITTAKTAKEIAIVVAIDSGSKFDENLLVLRSVGRLEKVKARGEMIKFNATVTGSDPRSSGTSELPANIQVKCTWDYHI